MKIAFYKGLHPKATWVDWLVCIATLSPYSHCEIIFSDGHSASASRRDRGVRFADIDFGSGRWDVYNLNLSRSQEVFAQAMFNLHEGCRYGKAGAVASWVRVNFGAPNKFFCSGICALACGLKDSARSPSNLFAALKRRGLISSKTILWDIQ